MSRSLPWPSGNESLFKVDPTSWDVACLNFNSDMSYGYAKGYRVIVEWALERVLRKGRHMDSDYVIYPVLFNFRHYIELTLKKVIRDCAYIDSHGQKDKPPIGHDIEKLWKAARAHIEKLFPDAAAGEKASLDAVEQCLTELSNYDPRSTCFRYERQLDGSRSLEGVTHIDLRHVQDIVAKVGTFLDCTDTMVSNAREWAQDCLAEMREEVDRW